MGSDATLSKTKRRRKKLKHISTTSLNELSYSVSVDMPRHNRSDATEPSVSISESTTKPDLFSPLSPLSPEFDDDDEDEMNSKKYRSKSADITIDDSATNSLFAFESGRKHKLSMDSTDGCNDSDDDDAESEEDNELKKELEAEFEKNSDDIMKIVDNYTHTIDDIESGRKKLAKKIVNE